MTIFKTFLKVLNKCKAPIILYTVILIFFAGFNMKTSDNSMSFTPSKPDILIINNDEKVGITESLIKYIEEKSNIIDIENDEEAINDALFYRDINYIIYIPKNFREDFLNKKNPKIEIKSTGDYMATLAQMMLERYIKTANIYNADNQSEEEIINNVTETLKKESKVQITSKLDTDNLTKATFYYNFTNYSFLAGSIFVICLILSSFKDEKIRKRTIISSMDYKKYNLNLLISSSLIAIMFWIFYVILSFILIGNVMFSLHGLIYIINSFIFALCALTISILLGNLNINKEAINGIVNVIALGSSFLCGAFVPMEMLPDAVLKIAHILPSYWYIKTNEAIKTMQSFNFEAIKPLLINMLVLVGFSLLFILITNIISKKKRKIA